MVKNKGDRTYGKREEKKIYKYLNNQGYLDTPKSTNALTRRAQEYISKIHHRTMSRILKDLKEEGLLRSKKLGDEDSKNRTTVWFK